LTLLRHGIAHPEAQAAAAQAAEEAALSLTAQLAEEKRREEEHARQVEPIIDSVLEGMLVERERLGERETEFIRNQGSMSLAAEASEEAEGTVAAAEAAAVADAQALKIREDTETLAEEQREKGRMLQLQQVLLRAAEEQRQIVEANRLRHEEEESLLQEAMREQQRVMQLMRHRGSLGLSPPVPFCHLRGVHKSFGFAQPVLQVLATSFAALLRSCTFRHACIYAADLTNSMAAARAVMDFEEQEHAREVERQRKLMQHTTRLLFHTLLRHYDVWKEFVLSSRMARCCLQTGERRREARAAFVLRRSAAMLLQAHVRLYVSKKLGQLREEERMRVEEARKKRLLNNTPAAKAVGKVTQRFIGNWQAISEPYQHLPFHGLRPSTTSLTTSFLAAQQQAQENERKIQVSLDESIWSNTLTDRLDQLTDSDEDDRDFTGSEGDDDELEPQMQELSSEMQRIQAAVKRGGMRVRVSQNAYNTKRQLCPADGKRRSGN
jgi:hypothetical protein